MHGRILDYSVQGNNGTITGTDGNRCGASSARPLPRVVEVCLLALSIALTGGPAAGGGFPTLRESARLYSVDGELSDSFGLIGVAIDGDTVVVGDEGHGHDLVDDAQPGAVFVFERDERGAWVQTDELFASDPQARGRLGEAVDIQADTIVAGADGAETVYVFERSEDGDWRETAKVRVDATPPAPSGFSSSLALDGRTLAVGAPYDDETAGSAFVFERSSTLGWIQVARLLASDRAVDDEFGDAVSVDGDTIAVGARLHGDLGYHSGAVYVFERDPTDGWLETAEILASDGAEHMQFGCAVAIEGDTLAVGALGRWSDLHGHGATYIFERENGAWIERDILFAFDLEPERFGESLDLDDGWLIVGDRLNDTQGDRAGAAFLFHRKEGEWAEVAKLLPSDTDGCICDPWGCSGCEYFAEGVAIDGRTRTAIGTSHSISPVSGRGLVYLFEAAETSAARP